MAASKKRSGRNTRKVIVAKSQKLVAPADYKDTESLKKFLGPQGQIQGRSRTGFGAQDQMSIKRAIKRARHLALLPFVG